jgi:hypothetical protein
MKFEHRAKKIKKILFSEYEISDKIRLDDWTDEANELAIMISDMTDEELVADKYNDYLESTFKDDEFTDFMAISKKLVEAVSGKY